MGGHLVYHIDEGLSIIPTEILDYLSFIGIGEDVRDQGYALFSDVRVINQAFPCWEAAVCTKPIRPANPGFQRFYEHLRTIQYPLRRATRSERRISVQRGP